MDVSVAIADVGLLHGLLFDPVVCVVDVSVAIVDVDVVMVGVVVVMARPRFTADAAERMRAAIRQAGGIEIFSVGQVDERPVILCMGSVTATALEAQAAMAGAGREVAVLSLRLLAPLPTKQLATLLASGTRLLVVEHNHGAQLWHYLRSLLPQLAFESLALPGPTAIQPRDIYTALEATNAT